MANRAAKGNLGCDGATTAEPKDSLVPPAMAFTENHDRVEPEMSHKMIWSSLRASTFHAANRSCAPITICESSLLVIRLRKITVNTARSARNSGVV